MSVVLKIKRRKDDFTQSETKLAEYVLENKSEVSNLSVQKLANLAGTSPASVIRFCKKVGYNGFQEFKINLVKDLTESKNKETKVYEDITVNDTIAETMQKLAHQNIEVIENTMKLIDEKEVKKAIEAIDTAERIYIFGVGASGLVAKDFQYKLMRIKKTVISYLDSHTQLASAVNIEEDDLAIGISYSGQTLEIYQALKQAGQKGATTLSITKYGQNPLSDLADINIDVAGTESNIRVGAITSRIAQLTAIDLLFVGYTKNDFEIISNYIKKTRASVEDFKLDK
ncbi:MurR/RpiR family transcriptional regulator [Natroniella sulfidigena]|uniref:MurR/RpiR family transcriptional regulator n=1 Tax=Natroniella sulfidigena TaxID=723921 RepID=UPI00200AC433|nr:MurR/RpiR family transcriptional regulator [Natroniella sulfidigena]MCK8817856.1 MurR/RpiR family transcriptional regulator [Natroniella sulfidigena]